jgi:rfaE bifunctional protein nucleotidyltransferase chain/domain
MHVHPSNDERQTQSWPSSFCTPDDLPEMLARLPKPWVFTNGVFDILHRGHIQYLEEARQLGRSLIVGLNSDASARRLGKGPGRPINSEQDRAWVMAGLSCVSLILLFDEPTPLKLLAMVQPEIYVKGGDYNMAALPEARLMQTWNGRCVSMPYLDGCSSTGVIERVLRAHGIPGESRLLYR